MLLFDGHASHISIQAIKFALEKKIILLCLPPHTTHLLQPLDVRLFGPLSTYYKNGIAEKTRFDALINIDKCDFLEAYHKARLQAISSHNIKSAWRDSGISLFNPEVVLSKIPRKESPSLPDSRPVTAGGPAPCDTSTPPNSSQDPKSLIPKTPANIAEV
jgi:hypothetical protein